MKAYEGNVIGSWLLINTKWSEPTSELYRTSDRRLSAKLVPTFADRGYHEVSVKDPFRDHSRCISLSSSSSIVLQRLRPTTPQKMW
jgi:hypothetical protein